MSHRKSVAELRRLPLEELVAILEEVFKLRQADQKQSESMCERLFIGLAQKNSESPQSYMLQAVAYPDPNFYGKALGPDWGFCQSGVCMACATTVRSNVKHALCPICGASVYLT
jgi:rubrerythrin